MEKHDDLLTSMIATVHDINARTMRLERAVFGDGGSGGGGGGGGPPAPPTLPVIAERLTQLEEIAALKKDLDELRRQVREIARAPA
jgi:hypothetical protein